MSGSEARGARLAAVAAGATVLLIGLGGLTTVSGAGMGCGDDWPLCQGKWLPDPADTLQLIEWSHRALAAVVGLLTVVAGAALWRGRAGAVALGWGLLAVQALLGRGAVVSELGDKWVLVAHLATSMAFLAVLGQWVGSATPAGGGRALARPATALLGLAWLQTVLGAAFVHTRAQHALWAHVAVGVAVAGLAMALMAKARRADAPPGLLLPTRVAGVLAGIQVILGAGLWMVLARPGHAHALVTHLLVAASVVALLAVAATRARAAETGS